MARGFNVTPPTTHAECAALMEGRKRRAMTIGGNTVLTHHEEGSYYTVSFHGSTIVTYYPTHKVLNLCGYASSSTTRDRASKLTGARIGYNSAAGFEEPCRVDNWPYFPGMRIDNNGGVLLEDCHKDFKQRVKPAVMGGGRPCGGSSTRVYSAAGNWGNSPSRTTRTHGTRCEACPRCARLRTSFVLGTRSSRTK